MTIPINFAHFSCVTGASKGIGAEICVKMANAGCVVIGLARSVDKIRELNNRLDNGNGSVGKIVAYKCDVENENEIKKAFQWVIRTCCNVFNL